MSRLKDLEAQYRKRTISRRHFMEGALAIGVSATLASSLISQADAATPKKGGRLRIGRGHGSTTDVLDPGLSTNQFTMMQIYGTRNCLTEIDHTGKLVPELAEGWEVSDDAAQWRFKLRKDVEFHNGKTLDTADVIASIHHHTREGSKSAGKELVKAIKEVKADGKDTVVFTLEAGNADFPYVLADFHLPIMPAKDGGVDWQSGVGTGAYAIENFDPGVRSIYKRFPNYFKKGRGHFDEVEMLAIGDVNARTSALVTGEIDVMDRVDLKTVAQLKRKGGLKVEETSSTAHFSVPMRTDMAPFDDNDVRMALKYAIDRKALLQTILRGHGTIGNDHPISPVNRYYASELPQRPYDPDKAKFHLKKAGLTKLEVPLSAADAAFAGAVDAAILYKEHAAPSGIDITVVREPNDGYWSNVWMKKGWGMCYWGGRPTEDLMFTTAYADGASWNDTFWKHDRFNVLLKAARAELNDAKRREMYVEMQRLVSDEGGVVIPLFNNYVFAMSNKVQHDAAMAGNWELDGNKAMERWWFA
jgi:peptide/nickel transport system substrate-binding protein